MMITLLTALAGGAGAATRYAVDVVVGGRASTWFPLATALINVSGSLLLGLVVGLGPGAGVESVVGVGFLGGYTTFSSASLETARLSLERRPWSAIGYGLGVLVVSVAAASAGYALGRW